MRRTEEEIIQKVERYKIIAILRKVPMAAFQNTVAALYRGGIRLMAITFDPSGIRSERET